MSKKIAIIIAFRNFRDEEYFIPKEIFEKNGFKVVTISTEKGTAVGGSGGDTEVDMLIEDINIHEFKAIVFVGGPGAYNYIENSQIHEIIKQASGKNKVVSAICIAPAILAKAGVLAGKRATIWSSPMDKKPIKILEENGANYQNKPVVVDGKIVTANGPAAAQAFAEKILQIL